MTTPIIPGTSAYLWPPSPGPITQIQPFTYSDGITFVEILYALKRYITDEIVPAFNGISEEVDKAIADMIVAVDAALAAQNVIVQEKIDEMILYVDNAVAQIIGDSIEVQDPVVAGIVNDSDSDTRIALDAIYTNIVEDPADPGFYLGSR